MLIYGEDPVAHVERLQKMEADVYDLNRNLRNSVDNL